LIQSDVIFSAGTITDYINTSEKEIVIPDNFQGIAVTSIASRAFEYNKLKSVEIPNSVITIGSKAFYYNHLNSLTIGNNVASIGDSAFQLNDLQNLTIPNSVQSMGDGAFQYNKLTSVSLSQSLTSINNMSFAFNELISITIPNSVTAIGNSAFSYNKLDFVSVPKMVTEIGKYAFYENNLSAFTLPSSYEGKIYSWSDDENNTYQSGDDITNFLASYTIGDEVITNLFWQENGSIEFYPNPSTDSITFDFLISQLTVTDLEGGILKEFKTMQKRYSLANLPAGLYFMKAIDTEGTVYFSKIIKE
jgi:hypothetical protein